MTAERYKYEVAEAAIDALVVKLTDAGCPGVARAYQKAKWAVALYALCDYLPKYTKDRAQAKAWAWEDLDTAMRGYGDSFLTGVACLMSNSVSENEAWEKEYIEGVESAFAAAEAATSKDVPRRYLKQYRTAKVRTVKEGYHLPCILPCFGPSVREWALLEGKIPDEVESALTCLEFNERTGEAVREAGEKLERAREKKRAKPSSPSGVKLRVIDGGQEKKPKKEEKRDE